MSRHPYLVYRGPVGFNCSFSHTHSPKSRCPGLISDETLCPVKQWLEKRGHYYFKTEKDWGRNWKFNAPNPHGKAKQLKSPQL